MSRAFVKEDDNETAALSDRPVSDHRYILEQNWLAAPYTPRREFRHGISKARETTVRLRRLTPRAPTTFMSEKDTFFVA
jgi:hypothetical protein